MSDNLHMFRMQTSHSTPLRDRLDARSYLRQLYPPLRSASYADRVSLSPLVSRARNVCRADGARITTCSKNFVRTSRPREVAEVRRGLI